MTWAGIRLRALVGAFVVMSAVDAGAWCSIRRLVVDGALVAGAAEIQEAGPQRRVVQTFTPPQEAIAGVELFVARYPRHESLGVAIRVAQGERELGFGIVPIPTGVPMPVRVAFPPVVVRGEVSLEAWAPQGRPGHNAAIQFYPVDHYPDGELRVAGRPVRGDAAFRVLAPDSGRFELAPGIDLSGVPGRFPSPSLHEGDITQAFPVVRDSLAGIDLVAGTGGAAVGPPLGWELAHGESLVAQGVIAGIRDNQPFRLAFPPLMGMREETLKVTLRVSRGDSLRLWLCQGGSCVLTIRDRTAGGSLVMTTLHLVERTDSLRVVVAADAPLLPEPGPFLTGSCVMTQSFLWPQEPGGSDCMGIRLALGEGVVAGSLTYDVRDETRGAVVQRGSIEIGGRGRNDYLWLDLGNASRGRRQSVSVSARGTRAETASRFWLMPADVYREGEATGCVVRAGGDFVFRLAESFSVWQWVVAFPRLTLQLAQPARAPVVAGLLVARLALIVALGFFACAGRRVIRDET